jgi:4-diphosphocytidyl-2-C-methyl-D-erythritol kinase
LIKEHAYAKINLLLDVCGVRSDRYHELKMIMMPIDLYDILTFEKDSKISLNSNIDIPNNAIIRTAQLMQKRFNYKDGAKITLEKHIPIGSGLAGGSADIAATIRGLSRLWELELKIEDMEKIAIELGSDTLFCLHNKTAYVYGRGEHLLFVETPPIESIYLFTSHIQSSTKTVFENHEIKTHRHRFNRIFKWYINEKYNKFFKNTYNDLTKTTLSIYPELKEIQKKLDKSKLHYLMSGSGSTFYVAKFHKENKHFDDKLSEIGLNYIETTPKN